MHPQTACQLGPAVIVYQFHAFSNRHVVVLRRLRGGEIPSVVARVVPLPEDDEHQEPLCINVPCWMLDPAACAHIACQPSPRIEIRALLKLRTLIDVSSCKPVNESGSMNAKGARHEPRNANQTSADDSASETTST
jgi:hypothetical protein